MINFTDFDRLAEEEDVALRDAATPGDLAGTDVIALPGTKNTVEDLRYLGQAGFTEAIRERVARRREVVGIWGSYQMLGRSVADPDGAEPGGIAEGFGLLNMTTRLLTNKFTRLVEADPLHFDVELPPQGAGTSFTWVKHREVMHATDFTYVLHVVCQISRSECVMYRRTVPSVQAAWFGERTFMGCSTGPVFGEHGESYSPAATVATSGH